MSKKGDAAKKPAMMKNKKKGEETKKKKKPRTTYIQYDKTDLIQFTLLDAMRYVCPVHVSTDSV